MAVSEERINILLDQMIENVDEHGWCRMPENLSDEEYEALNKELTVITMKARVDTLMDGILNTIKYMVETKEHIDDYEMVERLKLKGSLYAVKEYSQTILIDLHSEDKISDFFKIDLVIDDGVDVKEEDIKLTNQMMNDLIETKFTESMGNIKNYCDKMIEMADELIGRLNE